MEHTHPPPPLEKEKKSNKFIDLLNNFSLLQFSEDFQIMLFHYDGRTTEWDEFEWSRRAIHVSVKKQTKWLDRIMF